MSNMRIIRTWVTMLGRAGCVVYWRMGETPSAALFTVEVSDAPNGTWLAVGQTAGWWLVDPAANRDRQRTYYRVTATAGTKSTVGQPVQAGGGLSHRDWLLARNILRKEQLNMVKGVGGRRGKLLKRRVWGDPCIACREFVTGSQTTPHCTSCYGTGIVGGYFPPVDFWAVSQPYNKNYKVADTTGQESDNSRSYRFIALPPLDPGDIWVDGSTGGRYEIGTAEKSIQVAAAIRGVPLVYLAQLDLVPDVNVIYDYPIDGVEDSFTPGARGEAIVEPAGEVKSTSTVYDGFSWMGT